MHVEKAAADTHLHALWCNNSVFLRLCEESGEEAHADRFDAAEDSEAEVFLLR